MSARPKGAAKGIHPKAQKAPHTAASKRAVKSMTRQQVLARAIPAAACTRLARCAGIMRASTNLHLACQFLLDQYLTPVLRSTLAFNEASGRKMITPRDAAEGLKFNRITVVGGTAAKIAFISRFRRARKAAAAGEAALKAVAPAADAS